MQWFEDICTTSNHGNMTALLEIRSVYLDVRYTLKKTSVLLLKIYFLLSTSLK